MSVDPRDGVEVVGTRAFTRRPQLAAAVCVLGALAMLVWSTVLPSYISEGLFLVVLGMGLAVGSVAMVGGQQVRLALIRGALTIQGSSAGKQELPLSTVRQVEVRASPHGPAARDAYFVVVDEHGSKQVHHLGKTDVEALLRFARAVLARSEQQRGVVEPGLVRLVAHQSVGS